MIDRPVSEFMNASAPTVALDRYQRRVRSGPSHGWRSAPWRQTSSGESAVSSFASPEHATDFGRFNLAAKVLNLLLDD